MSSTSAIARLPRAGRPSSGPERSLRARDVMRSPAPAVSPDTPLTAVATLLAATAGETMTRHPLLAPPGTTSRGWPG